MRSDFGTACALLFFVGTGCGGRATTDCAPAAIDAGAAPNERSPVLDTVLDPRCPSSEPAPLSGCSRNTLECEYGNDLDPECNVVAECSDGQWSSLLPQQSGCPGFVNRIDPTCPARRADVLPGGACTTIADCGYPDGRCACAMFDGATDGPTLPFIWICEVADPRCAMTRPRIGSACTTSGQTCHYGACGLSSSLDVTCTEGVWQWGYARTCGG